jgi:hypothetical protein
MALHYEAVRLAAVRDIVRHRLAGPSRRGTNLILQAPN